MSSSRNGKARKNWSCRNPGLERWISAAQRSAVSRLPAELRRAVVLYYWGRQPGHEVGRVLGIPENTARSRIRRARLRLRADLVH